MDRGVGEEAATASGGDGRARRLAAGALCSLGLVGLLGPAACSSDDPVRRAPPGGVEARTADGCETDDGTSVELEPLVTDDVPDHFEAAPDGDEVPGPVDLRFLTAFVYLGADDVLAEGGFRRGFQRLWYGFADGQDDGDLALDLLEFCDVAGAEAFVRWYERDLGAPGFELEAAEGDEPPGVAATLVHDVPNERYALTLLAHGPFAVVVSADAGTEEEPVAELAERAQRVGLAQVADLP